ncbi:mRNA export factor GLE1, partial [Balamuthia mandrillaris]
MTTRTGKTITQRIDERRVAKAAPEASAQAATVAATKPNCIVWMVYYEEGNARTFALNENTMVSAALPRLVEVFKEKQRLPASLELEAKVFPSSPTDKPPQLFKRNCNNTPVILVHPKDKTQPQLSELADLRGQHLIWGEEKHTPTGPGPEVEEWQAYVKRAEKDRETFTMALLKAEEDRKKAEEDRKKAEEDREAFKATIVKHEEVLATIQKKLAVVQTAQHKMLRCHLLNLARIVLEDKTPTGILSEDDVKLIQDKGRVRDEGNRADRSGKASKIAESIFSMPTSTTRSSLEHYIKAKWLPRFVVGEFTNSSDYWNTCAAERFFSIPTFKFERSHNSKLNIFGNNMMERDSTQALALKPAKIAALFALLLSFLSFAAAYGEDSTLYVDPASDCTNDCTMETPYRSMGEAFDDLNLVYSTWDTLTFFLYPGVHQHSVWEGTNYVPSDVTIVGGGANPSDVVLRACAVELTAETVFKNLTLEGDCFDEVLNSYNLLALDNVEVRNPAGSGVIILGGSFATHDVLFSGIGKEAVVVQDGSIWESDGFVVVENVEVAQIDSFNAIRIANANWHSYGPVEIHNVARVAISIQQDSSWISDEQVIIKQSNNAVWVTSSSSWIQFGSAFFLENEDEVAVLNTMIQTQKRLPTEQLVLLAFYSNWTSHASIHFINNIVSAEAPIGVEEGSNMITTYSIQVQGSTDHTSPLQCDGSFLFTADNCIAPCDCERREAPLLQWDVSGYPHVYYLGRLMVLVSQLQASFSIRSSSLFGALPQAGMKVRVVLDGENVNQIQPGVAIFNGPDLNRTELPFTMLHASAQPFSFVMEPSIAGGAEPEYFLSWEYSRVEVLVWEAPILQWDIDPSFLRIWHLGREIILLSQLQPLLAICATNSLPLTSLEVAITTDGRPGSQLIQLGAERVVFQQNASSTEFTASLTSLESSQPFSLLIQPQNTTTSPDYFVTEESRQVEVMVTAPPLALPTMDVTFPFGTPDFVLTAIPSTGDDDDRDHSTASVSSSFGSLMEVNPLNNMTVMRSQRLSDLGWTKTLPSQNTVAFSAQVMFDDAENAATIQVTYTAMAKGSILELADGTTLLFEEDGLKWSLYVES